MGSDDLFNKFKKEISEEIRQEFEQSAQKEKDRYRQQIEAEVTREKEDYRRKIEKEVAEKAAHDARLSKLEADRAKEIAVVKVRANAVAAQKNWSKNLETGQGHSIRIGRTGHEEIYRKVQSSRDDNQFYITAAKEIIRRADPKNEIIKACVQQKSSNYELGKAMYSKHPVFTAILSQISKTGFYRDLKDAMAICKDLCLQRRCEGFRWVVLNPLYTSAGNDMRRKIEKELVRFFDRYFTSHVSHLMGKVTDFSRGEPLSLGGDHLLGEEQGIKFTHSDLELMKHNEECWKRIVLGDYP